MTKEESAELGTMTALGEAHLPKTDGTVSGGECDEIPDAYGICECCGEQGCPDCRPEYNQFTQIDYSIHKSCLEDRE
jgi:hypothetical protein